MKIQMLSDLHIEFEQVCEVIFEAEIGTTPLQRWTRPFKDERHEKTTKTHNLYNGTVKVGEKAQVRVKSDSGTIKVKKWWWTYGGTHDMEWNHQNISILILELSLEVVCSDEFVCYVVPLSVRHPGPR